MAKYEYWHLITEINEEDLKNVTKEGKESGIKVGRVVTHDHIHNGWVTFMDMTTGKSNTPYKIRYLKRLLKDMPLDERCDILKKLVDGVIK